MKSGISKMDALLFALSFELVLLQMRILEGSSDLRLRYWRPSNRIEELQHDKLVQDRDLVKDINRNALIEIVEKAELYSIKNVINVLKNKDCDVETLRATNNLLRDSLAKILLELEIKRNQWTSELQEADHQVAVLRDKISDDLLNANTRLTYSEKWLYAQFESLELQYDVPRPPKPRTDQEDRVHKELLNAYELQIKERGEALMYWQERYKTDIDSISVRVQDRCEQLRVASNRREELQNLYNLHAGEMRGWLNFKRERAARHAREEHNRKSAVCLQSWWRGVMVRRALGQFKYLRQNKKQTSKRNK